MHSKLWISTFFFILLSSTLHFWYLLFTLTFHSCIYRIFVTMNDNSINIERERSRGSASSSLRRRMESESHFLPSISRDFELEITSMVEDSKIKWVLGDSFSERALSGDSSRTLLLGKSGGVRIMLKYQCPSYHDWGRNNSCSTNEGMFVWFYQRRNEHEPSYGWL